MSTEISKTYDANACAGWIFFDAECGVCVAGQKRFRSMLERRGFRWMPLQTPGTAIRLGMSEAELLAEMRLQLADGRVLGGIDVWVHLWRRVWWLWPLGVLVTVPGVRFLAQKIYRLIARNRHCLSGVCNFKKAK